MIVRGMDSTHKSRRRERGMNPTPTSTNRERGTTSTLIGRRASRERNSPRDPTDPTSGRVRVARGRTSTSKLWLVTRVWTIRETNTSWRGVVVFLALLLLCSWYVMYCYGVAVCVRTSLTLSAPAQANAIITRTLLSTTMFVGFTLTPPLLPQHGDWGLMPGFTSCAITSFESLSWT